MPRKRPSEPMKRRQEEPPTKKSPDLQPKPAAAACLQHGQHAGGGSVWRCPQLSPTADEHCSANCETTPAAVARQTPLTFVILRGTTGMGKSFLADRLARDHRAVVCSCDHYWQQHNCRQWSLEGHRNEAMPWCTNRCRQALDTLQRLVVLDNWNLKISKFEGLFRLAKSLQYHILIVAICARDYDTARAALERNSRAGWDEARKVSEAMLFDGFQVFRPDGVARIERHTPLVDSTVYDWVVRQHVGSGSRTPITENVRTPVTEREPLLWSSAPGAVAVRPRGGELAVLHMLAACVPFTRGKVEVAGSFALNVFQRLYERELHYALPYWAYNDIDIFVCNGDESGGDASGFETILAAFEKKLVENGHTVEKRLVKYFVAQTGDANVDTVVADGDVGRKRLVDYTLAGIPISVSLVNTLHQRNIVAVLNSFDLSACAISCTMDENLHFEFNFGAEVFGPSGPREDCLSGTAHIQYTTINPKRQGKYAARGFHRMEMIAKQQLQADVSVAAADFLRTYAAPSMPEVAYRRMPPSSTPTTTAPRRLPQHLTVLTLNCNADMNGTNAEIIADVIFQHHQRSDGLSTSDGILPPDADTGVTADLVCLQEVTVELYKSLLKDTNLAEVFEFYSVMDKEHVLQAGGQLDVPQKYTTETGKRPFADSHSVHGLAILSRVAVVEFWSVPLQRSNQSRRVDVAIGSGWALANLHAESMQHPSCETIRAAQFEQVVAELRNGVALAAMHGGSETAVGLLAGDLNTRSSHGSGRALDLWLREQFEDTNTSGQLVKTYIGIAKTVHLNLDLGTVETRAQIETDATKKEDEDEETGIDVLYYDRVLQLAPVAAAAVDWQATAVDGLSDHKVVTATLALTQTPTQID